MWKVTIFNLGRFGLGAWALILSIADKSWRMEFCLPLFMLLYMQPKLMWSLSIPTFAIAASKLFSKLPSQRSVVEIYCLYWSKSQWTMVYMMLEGMNSSSQVSTNWLLIPMFLYKELLAISRRKAPIMQCFYILTNALNCLGRSNDLLPHTTFTTLSTSVVSDGSKSSNGLGFYGRSTKCLRTPLYNLR